LIRYKKINGKEYFCEVTVYWDPKDKNDSAQKFCVKRKDIFLAKS